MTTMSLGCYQEVQRLIELAKKRSGKDIGPFNTKVTTKEALNGKDENK